MGAWGYGIALLGGLGLAAGLQSVQAILLGAPRRRERAAFAVMPVSFLATVLLGLMMRSTPDPTSHARLLSAWILSWHPFYIGAAVFVTSYAGLKGRLMPVAIAVAIGLSAAAELLLPGGVTFSSITATVAVPLPTGGVEYHPVGETRVVGALARVLIATVWVLWTGRVCIGMTREGRVREGAWLGWATLLFSGFSMHDALIDLVGVAQPYLAELGFGAFIILMNRELARDLVRAATAEEALKESEAQYRALVEDQTEFVVRWLLPDGKRTFVNQAYARFFDGTADELVGTSFLPLVAPEDRERILAKVRSLTPEQPFATAEHRVLHPDGTHAGWQEWTDRARFDEQGNVVQMLSVGRDVTARRQAQAALEESERRLRAVFEQSAEHMILLSGDGTVLMANRAADEFRDPTFEPGVGMPAWESPWFSHSESLQLRVRELVQRCLAGETLRFEASVPNAEGEVRTLAATYEPILDDSGEVVMVFGRATDVTETRTLQRELTEITERERQRIGQDLHDSLGQQLTGIGYLARALERELQGRDRAEAETAATLKRQVLAALQETRFLSRALLPVAFGEGGLEGALNELAEQTRLVFGVECRVAARGVPLLPDEVAADLVQIAREAVTNAVRHGECEAVAIELTTTPEGVTLAVVDDGIGMDAAVVDDSGGIGLRIMRYRAQRIGATLLIQSGDGSGTAVRCFLPSSRTR